MFFLLPFFMFFFTIYFSIIFQFILFDLFYVFLFFVLNVYSIFDFHVFVIIILLYYFLLLILCCFLMFFFVYCFAFFEFLLLFVFSPYFWGISLNSRADLEFKEFRLFPRLFLLKDRLKSNVFIEKSWLSFLFPRWFFGKKLNFMFFNNCGKRSKFLKFKVSPWISEISAGIRKKKQKHIIY